jgi:hypothetical protein
MRRIKKIGAALSCHRYNDSIQASDHGKRAKTIARGHIASAALDPVTPEPLVQALSGR